MATTNNSPAKVTHAQRRTLRQLADGPAFRINDHTRAALLRRGLVRTLDNPPHTRGAHWVEITDTGRTALAA